MIESFGALLKSRKFLIMVLDVAVSMVLYFVGKYGDPSLLDDLKFTIAALQPVAIAIIAAIAYEDGQAMAAGLRNGLYRVVGEEDK